MPAEFLMVASAQWLNDHATAVVLIFATIAFVAEHLRRTRRKSDGDHSTWLQTWWVNVTLFACTLAVSWTLGPWLSPIFSTALGSRSGLLHVLELPASSYALYVVAGVLLLDLLAYVIHRAMHAIPLLWRFHQVHHSDEHMNASTHFRQHPVQIVAVALLQLPMLWLLGISAVSWVVYVTLGTALQLWQHSAVASSSRFERVFRHLVVTPTMHRIHHDARQQFHNANYGALLPLWDRLFRTCRSSPSDLQPGLWPAGAQRRPNAPSLLRCLLLPFLSLLAPDTPSGQPSFQTRPQGRT